MIKRKRTPSIHSSMTGYVPQCPMAKPLGPPHSVYLGCRSAGSLGRRTILSDPHAERILQGTHLHNVLLTTFAPGPARDPHSRGADRVMGACLHARGARAHVDAACREDPPGHAPRSIGKLWRVSLLLLVLGKFGPRPIGTRSGPNPDHRSRSWSGNSGHQTGQFGSRSGQPMVAANRPKLGLDQDRVRGSTWGQHREMRHGVDSTIIQYELVVQSPSTMSRSVGYSVVRHTEPIPKSQPNTP